ncbi:hypothetical protein MACH09_47050 [Vibrio sp. MACH09]|uniref:type IV conjugative transfer system pilin TraA n=1 Tax=Vibrio sp. MACH09 TaxID=3025122 RepID=UPI0027930E77|nr:type IV conjugative transfer system pilin TraA [Vibrio sp. MACH09]GLO64197.1 hypothetical protein MACH09_47050 [Vibrio sp. MACH09]
MNKQNQLGKAFTLAALATIFVTQPALAADIFGAGKAIIKDTAGTGSTIETAMLGTGLAGAAVTGFMTRNWFGAVGGFAAGNILWKVGAPMVGLA